MSSTPANINRQERGYLVRLTRQGTQYRQFFSDYACGSQEEALAAAIGWRDRKRQQVPLAQTHGESVDSSEIHAQNWSGVRGLGLTKNKHGNLCVQADDGPGARRRRSIPHHGLKRALRECCAWLAERRDVDAEKMFEVSLPRFRERT